MSDAPELKFCPFCGGPAEMEPWHGGGPDKQLIGCMSDVCEVGPGVTGETPKEAVALWNKRGADEATTLLRSLAKHEEYYRHLCVKLGAHRSETNRAWSDMRAAGDKARAFIDRTTP